jgi:hypothetical protein
VCLLLLLLLLTITVLEDGVDTLPIYNFSLGNKAKQQQWPRKVRDTNKQQPVVFTNALFPKMSMSSCPFVLGNLYEERMARKVATTQDGGFSWECGNKGDDADY